MYCVIIELKGILYNNINVKKEKNDIETPTKPKKIISYLKF